MKIIIGSGGTNQPGWLSLERGQLDIRDRAQWVRLFAPNSLDAVLSEHVLEHLTFAEANAATRNIYKFLTPGGYWRIAIPDANNPDPKYQDMCRPGGVRRSTLDSLARVTGEPGHKEHYDLDSLTALLQSTGFDVSPLEWYDKTGRLQRWPWDPRDGEIRRHAGHRDLLVYLWADCWNTSLIVDAIKPASTLEHRQLYRWDPEASLR
jgi:predicted SAM-dependent methyltransferase